jgi:hypothetical protein
MQFNTIESEEVSQLLLRFGLAFDAQTKLVFCNDQLCQRYLNSSPFSHMAEFHQISVDKTTRDLIQEYLSQNSSVYTTSGQEALPPVPNVTILDGFECVACLYYCRTKGTMDWHRKKAKHSPKSYRACKVQTLSVGNSKKYFKVLDPGNHIDEARSVPLDLDDAALVSSALQTTRRPPKDLRNENLFYEVQKWYTTPDDVVPIRFYETVQLNPNQALTKFFQSYLSTLYQQYLAVDYNLKCLAMFGTVTKSFNSLGTEKSQREYIKYWVQFLLFLTGGFVSTELSGLATAVTLNPTTENLRQLLLHVLQREHTIEPSEIVEFIKYS